MENDGCGRMYPAPYRESGWEQFRPDFFLTHPATTTTGITMNIADPDQAMPRGVYMGTPSRPMCEAERFKRCPVCGGYIDILDLGWVTDHEGSLPHPVRDGVQ